MDKRFDFDAADLSRRDILKAAAAGGTGLLLGAEMLSADEDKNPAELNLALIGAGTQGRVLLTNCLKMKGLTFKAVCDIWGFSQQYGSRLIDAYQRRAGKDPCKVYTDYREMLAKEEDLDAVLIATPDWMHAEHTIACLEAGLDVYCEKEMSHDLAEARKMVAAQRKSGKLLQIGHQRRSNPRYLHAHDKLLREAKLLGRVTHAYGQWNRGVRPDEKWPKGKEIDPATLKKYGYANMHEFRNWRWYKKYGGGPIVDLGSHQIDVFSWFFGTNPRTVQASGGVNYYDNHEWYDNVMTLYEYETPEGVARAYYQVLTTTSARGYFESFMGIDGTLQMSESPAKCRVYSEGRLAANPHPWDKWKDKGYLLEMKAKETETVSGGDDMHSKILSMYGPSPAPATWMLPVAVEQAYHRPHLQNFFDAVRAGDKKKLNCPAEIGYETAVAVLRVNDAVAAKKTLEFGEGEFEV